MQLNRPTLKFPHQIQPLTILIALAAIAFGSAQQASIRVLAGDIRDNRTTDNFFGGLEVELKVLGDVLADARGIRLQVDRAVDETGKNLIDEKKMEADFNEISQSESGRAEVKIKLKNPARQAMAVQEISGSIELFIPNRDPKAVALFPSFLRQTGMPFSSPSLKSAGIVATAWTKEQYEARKKAEEEKRRRAAKPKSGEDLGEGLAEGLAAIFGSMFSAFQDMGENSIAFQIEDPNLKLIAIEFEDPQGKAISRNGRMTIGDRKNRTEIYEFDKKLPPSTRIKLLVLTPKASVRAPFKVSDLPLP
jgi:hypothetical protein